MQPGPCLGLGVEKAGEVCFAGLEGFVPLLLETLHLLKDMCHCRSAYWLTHTLFTTVLTHHDLLTRHIPRIHIEPAVARIKL